MEPYTERTSTHRIEGENSFTRSPECDDPEKSLLFDDRGQHRRSSLKSRSFSKQTWITLFNFLLFLTSLVILWASSKRNPLTEQDHWRATSYYSPIFDRFDIPKVSRVTNGSFWDTDPPSIWCVRAGDEADTHWERVGSNVWPIIINANEVRALGKDPNVAVKVPEELGHGSEAYIAGVDVFHHLHCLDKLRREISYGHYHEKEEGPAPGSPLHVAHINHCIDVLSQALKCTGSVDMVTFNWVEGHRMPQPDFNNNKVCRDFDSLLNWVTENRVDNDAFFKYAPAPPTDAIILPEVRPA